MNFSNQLRGNKKLWQIDLNNNITRPFNDIYYYSIYNDKYFLRKRERIYEQKEHVLF